MIEEAINFGNSKINDYFDTTRPSEDAVKENMEDWSESTKVIAEKIEAQTDIIKKSDALDEKEKIIKSYDAIREIFAILYELIFGLAYMAANVNAIEKIYYILRERFENEDKGVGK